MSISRISILRCRNLSLRKSDSHRESSRIDHTDRVDKFSSATLVGDVEIFCGAASGNDLGGGAVPTTVGYEKILKSYVGRLESDLISRWGLPIVLMRRVGS